MARRFSDINKGGELKFALDNLNTYKTNMTTRQTKRVTGSGTPTARPTVLVSIYPFSAAPLAGGTTFEDFRVKMGKASATAATNNFGLTKANNYFASPAEATSTKAPTGFSPARMSTFHPTAAATYKRSKFTQLYYINRTGESYHQPLGRLRSNPGASGDEREVKNAILADLADEVNATAGRRLSFKDEKMGGLG